MIDAALRTAIDSAAAEFVLKVGRPALVALKVDGAVIACVPGKLEAQDVDELLAGDVTAKVIEYGRRFGYEIEPGVAMLIVTALHQMQGGVAQLASMMPPIPPTSPPAAPAPQPAPVVTDDGRVTVERGNGITLEYDAEPDKGPACPPCFERGITHCGHLKA